MAESAAKDHANVSRRTFLKGLGLGAVATTMAPALLRADQVASQAKVLGSGAHSYEVVKGWGVLPAGKQFGYTHGVQEDAQGRIFIHNQSQDAVMIFDAGGKFIKSWGEEFKNGAHGMQLRREGGAEYLYLADYARHIVVKTTLDGEEVWTLRYPQESGLYQNEGEYKPTNVAFAPNGDFYVTDGYGKGYIHHYNIKAQLIRSWGGAGTEPGRMNCPHGIWVDKRGDKPVLTVADRENHRLQIFSLDGQPLGFAHEELRRPCHFDQRGADLLIPDLQGRVTIFDENNKLVTHLGDNPNPAKRANPDVPPEQRVAGEFCSPHAAIWDRAGNIYVVEWLRPGRVTKLRKGA